MHLLLLLPLFWLSGTFGLSGPGAVRGREWDSVTVTCRYGSGWEDYIKYWCRGANWNSCKSVVRTSGSEQEVKNDRVSIRDNHKARAFTVTMKELKREDADTYYCGIEKVGSDPGHKVQVTVDPAPATVPTTTSATTITTTNLTTNVSTTLVTPEESKGSPTESSSRTLGNLPVKILIPLILAVLLLLLVPILVLKWRMLKRQKEDAERSPDQELQTSEGELCYANLTLHQTEASLSSSRKKARTEPSQTQEEVEYVIMPSLSQAPFPREEVSYATLSLNTSNSEPTYGNMDYVNNHVSSRNQEENIEYSTIRKT